MTLHPSPLRKMFSRYFPRKARWAFGGEQNLFTRPPTEQKKDLALEYLSQGEFALLQGNLKALSFFEKASELDPKNPKIWHRQGLAFFEYGSEEGKEKGLLIASKHFKTATQLDPSYFEAWVAWGNSLLQLARAYEEHHFRIEAKEKYQRALALSEGRNAEELAELYWDYGLVWFELALHSGEALDVRLAIEAFQTSESYSETPSAEFLHDCGQAYLEMGLLINDSRLYAEAIEYLKKSVQSKPSYLEGWVALADAYSQLYINTLDEKYVTLASQGYAKASQIAPQNAEVWLAWGQLLGESGRLTTGTKSLQMSVEKCALASTLDPENTEIISQLVESLSLLGSATARLDQLIEAEHKVLQATDLFPDDIDLLRAHGIVLIGFAKYYEDPDYIELAIEKLQHALSIDRTDAEVWHALGLAHHFYADLTQDPDLMERASRFFTKAMDLKPSSPALIFDTARSLLQTSETTEDLPSLQMSLSLFGQLLQHYKTGILHHPEWLFSYACALEWLGHLSDEEKHFAKAIEIFSHILLIDPDFPHIHHRLANCYMEMGHSGESENYRKALHFFRLAARQEEENDQNWLDWGLCLIHLAHYTLDEDCMHQLYLDAEQKLVQSGKLGNTAAYYHLASLYSILHHLPLAMQFIQKALDAKALPPLHELVEDDWLENLRNTEMFTEFFSFLQSKLSQSRED